jgi:hypothetical protein
VFLLGAMDGADLAVCSDWMNMEIQFSCFKQKIAHRSGKAKSWTQ